MKIAFISIITPYRENVRGTSALSYHLIRGYRLLSNNFNDEDGENNCIMIYSFNANRLSKEKIVEVEKELKVSIKNVPLPRWYNWMFKLHLLPLRMFLKYPFLNYITLPKRVVEDIKIQHPNLIWVNGEELSRIVKQFPGTRRIQLGPDVESFYYYRMLGKRFVMNDVFVYWKCAMMYRKYVRLERHFCTDPDFAYYAVGKADIEHLQQLNPKVNCQFLRHPHYEVNNECDIHFHQPKIKLLVAGRYDLYMKQSADELFPLLTSNGCKLNDKFEITFLGKGWDNHVRALQQAGYGVQHIFFAHNYIEEIIKYDIQLTPISIGTGTKGKVLDALANGLLVLGTIYAFENIAVEHGKSCVLWKHAIEVPDILLDIANNREKYEQMAREGRDSVLSRHNPAIISQLLFSWIK